MNKVFLFMTESNESEMYYVIFATKSVIVHNIDEESGEIIATWTWNDRSIRSSNSRGKKCRYYKASTSWQKLDEDTKSETCKSIYQINEDIFNEEVVITFNINFIRIETKINQEESIVQEFNR